MTLSIAKTSFELPPNTIKDIYDSVDTENSPTWLVENLTAGTLYTIPNILNNMSDGGYCPATKRFKFIQNNTFILYEFHEADVLAGTCDAGTMIRTVTLSGLAGGDTEGYCDEQPNFAEGGHSSYVTEESSGANRAYRLEWTRAELIGTSNIAAKVVRNQRTYGAPAAGNNEGGEGGDRDIFTETMVNVQEGRQIDNPIAFQWAEPADRDVDYIYTDPELTVTTPYDAQAVLDPTHDQSSIIILYPTNTVLVLSEIGDTIYQISLATGLEVSRFSVAGLTFQPEGLIRLGDNILLISESNEYMLLTYVAP